MKRKNISKKLHKAYWTGVTDCICCVTIAIIFATMFIVAW